MIEKTDKAEIWDNFIFLTSSLQQIKLIFKQDL